MDRIRKLKRGYFRRLGLTSSPDPTTLIKGVMDVYNVFLNVENENGGCFFVSDHEAILKKELMYVQLGLLSWDPNRPTHVKRGCTKVHKFVLYRSLMGTNALEG